MRRLLKWFLIVAALTGLSVAVLVPAGAWLQQRAVPKYLTTPVSRGRVETVVNSTGTVKPVRSVAVGSFASGPIAKIFVDFNDRVYGPRWWRPRGQLLAVIDKKLAQAALDRDKAGLDRDQAAQKMQEAEQKRFEALCEQADINHKRALELTDINADYLSKTDLDQYKYTWVTAKRQVELAKANVSQAEANVALSKANLANSEANLGYTNIYSPVDGIIIDRKVDEGQTVAASFQTPELFTVAEEMDKHMYIFASVDEADIGLIRAAQEYGRPVKFTVDAFPGDLFEGKIHQVRKNSTTTQNVVTYPVVIEAPNPDLKLMPGMTANISFEAEVKENVLRVPAAALRFTPTALQVRPEDKHYVETAAGPAAGDGSAKRSASEKAERSRGRQQRVVWAQDGVLLRAVPVKLGLIDNHFAELLDGDLADGQALVTGTESAFAPR
jgi:HlyD family secretion protein